MMNKTIYLFLLLTLFSCKNHDVQKNLNSAQIEDSTGKKNDCVNLINNFPKNFVEFNEVYGYDDVKGEGKMYGEYESHISSYFNCPDVTIDLKLQKAINIGVNGKWDADAVGLFQKNLLDLVLENPKLTLNILNEMPSGEASSFWYFLLDGPHPKDKVKIENTEKLLYNFGDSEQGSLLLSQIEKIKSLE